MMADLAFAINRLNLALKNQAFARLIRLDKLASLRLRLLPALPSARRLPFPRPLYMPRDGQAERVGNLNWTD